MTDQQRSERPSRVSALVNSPVPVRILAAVLALEALVMLVVAGLLVVELLTQQPNSLASSIGLVVLAVIAAAALIAALVGLLRQQSWTRSFSLVWQVLQVATAVVILQGDMADAIGWALAAVSLVGLLLVFHPQVTAWLRPEEDGER